MALPTLKPYFMTRGSSGGATSRVQKIAEQRMFEDAQRKMWTDNSRYFKSSYVTSQKEHEWTSEKSLRSSLEKYKTKYCEEGDSKKLDKRRQALKELLEQERETYEKEIKDKVSSAEYKESLKNRAEELRSAREQRRKEEANQKLLDHWRLNCPELREVKSRQEQRNTCEQWGHQITEKRKEKHEQVLEEQRYCEEAEKKRVQESKKQEEEAMRKKRERESLSLQLRKQMDEVRAKEEESVLIEQEQALLMEEQRELYEAEEKRRHLQDQQEKTEFRKVLLRQAKAKLRRRCQQVQEALELDLKILEEIAEKEREEQLVMTARREKEKRDALFMKKVMEEQLELEKQRERELDLLYQEEAAKMWQKREEEWAKEKTARQRLMAEVMAERQQQIEEKMEQLKTLQQETIYQREELLKDIEEANQLMERENLAKENMEKEQRRELKEQINQKQRRREEERLQQQFEEEQERLNREEQEVLIQDEITNITGRPHYYHNNSTPHDHMTYSYRPNSGRTSKYAWY